MNYMYAISYIYILDMCYIRSIRPCSELRITFERSHFGFKEDRIDALGLKNCLGSSFDMGQATPGLRLDHRRPTIGVYAYTYL